VTTPAIPGRSRGLFAVLLGVGCALYVVALGFTNPDFVSDFDQVWAGAQALLQGSNPYDTVGPGRDFDWRWPLYYPLPALLVTAPLGLLPVIGARAAFAGLSAALLGWAITRDGWQRLPIFISVSFLVTIELGQWSALYAAAFFIPQLAAIGVAKPNLGAALAAGDRSGRSTIWLAGGAIVLLGASFIIQPGWHEPWLQNVREAPHFRPPVLRPLGFLLLLALLKWRRPEARWLLAISIVPLPPSFYDQLLLAVVCITFRESLIFAASTCVLFFYVGFNTPQPDYLAWGRIVGNGTVWICYLPVLVMVLRRPNIGEVPFIRPLRAPPAQSQAS
jgi:hypothetical protein